MKREHSSQPSSERGSYFQIVGYIALYREIKLDIDKFSDMLPLGMEAVSVARSKLQSVQRYPLTTILGTDATVRLLRELTRHGGMLSAPELVRRTDLAVASVARGLEALERVGIVEALGTGRAVLHRLRTDHPLARALDTLFEAEETRFQAVLDSVREAAGAAGVGIVAVWLYGSVARGEDGLGSDLDLAFVADRSTLHALADALRDELLVPGERLGFSPSVVALGTHDVLRLNAEHDPWWTSSVSDAIPVMGPHPRELASVLRRAPGRTAA